MCVITWHIVTVLYIYDILLHYAKQCISICIIVVAQAMVIDLVELTILYIHMQCMCIMTLRSLHLMSQWSSHYTYLYFYICCQFVVFGISVLTHISYSSLCITCIIQHYCMTVTHTFYIINITQLDNLIFLHYY